jgi:hypothetical protein
MPITVGALFQATGDGLIDIVQSASATTEVLVHTWAWLLWTPSCGGDYVNFPAQSSQVFG